MGHQNYERDEEEGGREGVEGRAREKMEAEWQKVAKGAEGKEQGKERTG